MTLKLPIGIDDFKKVIEDGYLYVGITLMMRPRNAGDRGGLLEFKVADTSEGLGAALNAALIQIEDRCYGQDLVSAGVKLRSEIAVAFCGKEVRVRGREVRS